LSLECPLIISDGLMQGGTPTVLASLITFLQRSS